MNWVKALADSIDYMEDNLTGSLNIEDIAKTAMASPYHYQRMFYMLTGFTVQEYIRNRRLSMAAMEITTTNIKVIDLAMKYGYESSEAFSRAFKKLHGANPSYVKKNKPNIKAFPKLVIQINLKGDVPMDYRIERKKSFSFSGITRNFSTQNGANFINIPKFWTEVCANGKLQEMFLHAKDERSLGVCMPMNPHTGESFDYVIGIFSDEKVEGYDFHTVPEADWAVFEVRGPLGNKLQDTWKRIFSEWFPSTSFQHADLPEFEVYCGRDTSREDFVTEIWIPIIKE
ncbi:AraC family transcriptional regulator [Vallitalea longa]|uniref:AraC family transcriptional regulator n=1 Tax=Vallitalea longa TaxID=2936439 RepID=A0A9W5Y907_9FIRM|nr:AraC family transcriptional regulator [Vallitalea longa]GKX28281.1 AraC family transcriptional regulator [Vallitalea longa]